MVRFLVLLRDNLLCSKTIAMTPIASSLFTMLARVSCLLLSNYIELLCRDIGGKADENTT